MYRHLAHAPQFLEQVERVLAPAQADGSLDRAIITNRATADGEARVLARAICAPDPRERAAIEAGVAAFVEHAIGKMVTICRALRAAR
jgi:hypothetical protein